MKDQDNTEFVITEDMIDAGIKEYGLNYIVLLILKDDIGELARVLREVIHQQTKD